MSGFQGTAAGPQIPGLPTNFSPIVFDGFNGLNTKPTRQALQDGDLYWCNNWVPFGKNNLQPMPGVGSNISNVSAPTGVTIVAFKLFNLTISGTAKVYLVNFFSDGSARFYVSTDGGATFGAYILSAAASTFSVSPSLPACAQWGSTYLAIVATNGYWLFDGSVLYTQGTVSPIVTLTNVGSGYTSQPTITVGTHNTTAATVGTVAYVSTAGSTYKGIATIPVASGGSGYNAAPIVSIVDSSGSGTGASAVASISAGVVTQVTVLTSGANYNSATTTVSFQNVPNHSVTQPTFTATLTGGQITQIVVTNPGSGFLVTDPTTLPLYITGGGGSGAAGTITLMPFGVTGTAIETYAQHVWVASKNNLIYSAPGSPVDFNIPDGGGVLQSTDSFLKAAYVQLVQTNGFLYVIADSSINYISGVNTTSSGTTATTTFSNVNLDPQIGTILAQSVVTFSRQIVFATTTGYYAIVGGSVLKISDNLDGIFQGYSAGTITSFGPSGALTDIYGTRCYICLMPSISHFVGGSTSTNTLLCWNGRSWWTATQENSMTFIATLEWNGIQTAYATDGTNIFQIAVNTAATLTRVVQSKLWDTPSYIVAKKALRLLGLIYQPATVAPQMQVQIDNETTTRVFYTNTSTNPKMLANGQKWFKIDVDQTGYLLGITLTTAEANLILQSLTLVAQQYQTEV